MIALTATAHRYAAQTWHRANRLLAVQRELRDAVDGLSFAAPVSHVYNPLRYAWRPAAAYFRRYLHTPKEVLFLGMNPGPWGMAQTGVPFGDMAFVRDWLRLPIDVKPPQHQHPKRPVLGGCCERREVSGTRFWGWAQARFGTPDAFFARFGVLNYCPLCFIEPGAGGNARNRTPDKLAPAERSALFALCDDALLACCEELAPGIVVGVGDFAYRRAKAALPPSFRVERVLHPSPASPVANRGWAEQVERQLGEMGVSF